MGLILYLQGHLHRNHYNVAFFEFGLLPSDARAATFAPRSCDFAIVFLAAAAAVLYAA